MTLRDELAVIIVAYSCVLMDDTVENSRQASISVPRMALQPHLWPGLPQKTHP